MKSLPLLCGSMCPCHTRGAAGSKTMQILWKCNLLTQTVKRSLRTMSSAPIIPNGLMTWRMSVSMTSLPIITGKARTKMERESIGN